MTMPRNIRLLYLHSFLSDFCPHWPYQVIFFAQITGSYTSAMSVMALETLSAALLDIPTGVLSDRIGRRYTIACGSLSAALGVCLYAVSHGTLLLYAGAVLTGLSVCLFSGNNTALLFETLQADRQQDRFAHYRAGVGTMYQAALCLSAFSAIPLSGYGLRVVFVAAAIPQVLAIPVSLMFREPRVHLVQKQKSVAVLKQACLATARNPRLMLLIIGNAIAYDANEAKFKFQSAFIDMVWPSWGVGLYRGIHHGISIVGFRIAQRVVGNTRPLPIFAVRDVYRVISQTIGLFLQNSVSPLLFASSAIVFGPGSVASDHLMQQEFTDEQRATMGSLASSVGSVVFAVAAIGIGAVSDKFGIIAGVGFGVFLPALSLPIYMRLFRRKTQPS